MDFLQIRIHMQYQQEASLETQACNSSYEEAKAERSQI